MPNRNPKTHNAMANAKRRRHVQLLAGNEIPVFENRHVNLYTTAHMWVETPRITTELNIET